MRIGFLGIRTTYQACVLALLVLIPLLFLGGGSMFSQGISFENEDWDVVYKGVEMPKFPWILSQTTNCTARVSDGALLISDLGTQNTQRVFVENLWRMSPKDEITVAACVKVLSCSGPAGNCILVANGVTEGEVTLYPNKVVLESSGMSYEFDATKAFVTYRIHVKGSDIEVFVDEQRVIDGKGKFTAPAYNTRNQLFFGGGSSPATAEALWKYVAFKRTNEDKDPGRKRGTVKVIKQQILAVSEEDVNFPTAARLSNGTIFLSYSAGQHTVNEKGRNLISRDNGKTWETPKKPIPSRALAELPDKSVIAVAGWLTKPIRGKNVHPLTVQRIADPKKGEIETWKAELEFPYDPDNHGILVHRSLVRMPNGDLIGTGYGRDEAAPLPYRSYCYISHDQGKTWKYHSNLASGESPGGEGFDEPVMILLKNGDLLCHIRTGGPLLQVRSKDGGKTWSAPKQIADHGVDPDMIQLSNGAVVASYGRPGLSLKIDFDGTGEKWDRTFDIYRGSGCSYTSLVEIEPGLVVLFYTESGFCGANAGFYPLNRVMAAYIRIKP